MIKVGRFTAALLLVIVGVLLLIDQTSDTDYLRYMLDWWPLVLISLGCEYLVFNFIHRKGERHLRLDLGVLFLAVLISAVVVGTTQASRLPFDWAKNIRLSIDTLDLSFSSESGEPFDKGVTVIPLAAGMNKVVIDNPNGSVEMKAGPVRDMEVQTTIYVDKLDHDEAQRIADESVIEYTGDDTLTITAKGKEYTGGFPNKRKPRMNLVITVPSGRAADYELKLRNGKIAAADIPVIGEFKARTTNGTVTLSGLEADITAGSTNGAVEVSNVNGSVSINTTNGKVTAMNIGGDIRIDTTNGSITVLEAAGEVQADATNGTITVRSGKVGGDYELETMHGAIEVSIPSDADVEVKGSTTFGSVSTNLPLEVKGKEISGTIGTGKYKVKIDTNSKIDVNKID